MKKTKLKVRQRLELRAKWVQVKMPKGIECLYLKYAYAYVDRVHFRGFL